MTPSRSRRAEARGRRGGVPPSLHAACHRAAPPRAWPRGAAQHRLQTRRARTAGGSATDRAHAAPVPGRRGDCSTAGRLPVRDARTSPPMHRHHLLGPAARDVIPLRLYFFASFAALGLYSPFFPRWLVARGIQGVAMGATVAVIAGDGGRRPADRRAPGRLDRPPRRAFLRVACLGSFLAFAPPSRLAGIAHLLLDFFEILVVVLVFAAFRAPMLLLADVVAMEAEHDTGASVRLHARASGDPSASSRRRSAAAATWIRTGPGGPPGGGRRVPPRSRCSPPRPRRPRQGVARSGASLPSQGMRPPARRRPLRRGGLSSAAGDLSLLFVAVFVAELAISSYEICFSIYLGDLGASSAFIGLAWALARRGRLEILDGLAAAGSLLHRPLRRAAPDGARALGGGAPRCGALLSTLRSLPALMAVQVLHSPSVALFWVSALSHLKHRTVARSFGDRPGGLLRRGRGGQFVAGMLPGGGCTATWAAAARIRRGGGRWQPSAALLALYWTARPAPLAARPGP